MNRVRIIGLLLVFVGIAIQFLFENDLTDFLMGLLVVSGIVFLITGRIKANSSKL